MTPVLLMVLPLAAVIRASSAALRPCIEKQSIKHIDRRLRNENFKNNLDSNNKCITWIGRKSGQLNMLIVFSPARDATMKTYKQLAYEIRCQIYALNKTGLSQNKISQQLKVSQSTISR